MDQRKSLSIFIIFTLFLCFNFVSCGGSNSTPDTPLKVFTTSASGNGNLGSWTDANGKTGIAAADAICQAAADSAGLSGHTRHGFPTAQLMLIAIFKDMTVILFRTIVDKQRSLWPRDHGSELMALLLAKR